MKDMTHGAAVTTGVLGAGDGALGCEICAKKNIFNTKRRIHRKTSHPRLDTDKNKPTNKETHNQPTNITNKESIRFINQ